MAEEVRADDVTELYRIGAVRLPNGAVEYAAATGDLATTAEHEGSGFGGSLGVSPVLPAFQGLRNIMQDQVIVRSHDNIVSAGEVLCSIAESFAEVDSSGGEDLAALKEELSTGTDENGDPVEQHKLPPEIPPALTSSGEQTESAEEYEELDAPLDGDWKD